MSSTSTGTSTNSQLTTNFDLSKIFVYNNRYETVSVNNSEYDPMVLKAGTVMGRIAGTDKVFPCVASATDGSQFPIGILATDITITEGTTVNVPLCVAGDVVKDKIIFWNAPTDTFTSVVNSRTLFDRIQSDSVGIKITSNNENTYLDNQ